MNSAKEKITVVVVGAGPAGSSAALGLALQGHKAVLIDKAGFPRDKVCGDGIPGKVLKIFPQLGLNTEELNRLGFPIFGMKLYGPSGQQVTFGDSAVQGAAKSFCIPRKIFDNYLFEKASAQVSETLIAVKVTEIERIGSQWQLHLKDVKNGRERRLKADLVIAADGATSLLSRQVLHLKASFEHRFWGVRQYFTGGPFANTVHIIYDKRLLPGYMWIFPVGAHRANVGLMAEQHSFAHKRAAPIQTLFNQILHENVQVRRILAEAKAEKRYSGAPLPLGTLPGRRVADGFISIGDAAAFINPITGGGIYYAMQSGLVAAQIVVQAIQRNDWTENGLMAYENWWRRQLLPGFKAADAMRRLMRSEKKANYLFNRMQKQGIWAKLFISIYGQPLPRFFFLHPRFWLGVLAGSRNKQV